MFAQKKTPLLLLEVVPLIWGQWQHLKTELDGNQKKKIHISFMEYMCNACMLPFVVLIAVTCCSLHMYIEPKVHILHKQSRNRRFYTYITVICCLHCMQQNFQKPEIGARDKWRVFEGYSFATWSIKSYGSCWARSVEHFNLLWNVHHSLMKWSLKMIRHFICMYFKVADSGENKLR